MAKNLHGLSATSSTGVGPPPTSVSDLVSDLVRAVAVVFLVSLSERKMISQNKSIQNLGQPLEVISTPPQGAYHDQNCTSWSSREIEIS
ncbi:hypothetical protein Bca4012_043587 [Brassica carinata]|uniref:Uncharacterized protein n=1 Tax=Brassica carinata TaxID=52824 RepID=A0A8X7QWW3_BRACI|nr:hypothetical protein Bca52824_058745 [Brassica carinata]